MDLRDPDWYMSEALKRRAEREAKERVARGRMLLLTVALVTIMACTVVMVKAQSLWVVAVAMGVQMLVIGRMYEAVVPK